MSDNPFLRRIGQEKKQSKAYWGSRKQETNLANRMKAHRVSGSGSGTTKGDVRARGVMRIEAKLTGADSFRVTKQMLEKIQNASLVNDEIPAIVVGFLGTDGKPDPTQEVAVIPMWALKFLQSVKNDG